MAAQTDIVKKQKSKPVTTSATKKQTQEKVTAKKPTTKLVEKKVVQPQNLLSEVMEARERWLKVIKKEHIDKEYFKNKSSERSQKRILYFIRPVSRWWPNIREEIKDLNSKLSRFKKKGKSVSRDLWLPTVIRNAQQVTVRIYEARSDRKVTFEAAKKFAQKAEVADKILDEMTENHEYRISGSTGRKYKIFASNESGTDGHPFSEWAICVCPGGKLPKYSKKSVTYESREDNSKKLICTHNKSTLFVKVPKTVKN